MFTVTPIGRVVGGRVEPVDDDWDAVTATIRLDREQFTADALLGLGAFSHLEVLYRFHLVADEAVHTGARRPRGNPEWPRVGIFAQRGKDRPNRLGVSTCRIEGVDGLRDPRPRPRRRRRHAGARPQAVHARVPAARRGPPARVGDGADGRLLGQLSRPTTTSTTPATNSTPVTNRAILALRSAAPTISSSERVEMT